MPTVKAKTAAAKARIATRKPTDATMRNVRAGKRRDAMLATALEALNASVQSLGSSVADANGGVSHLRADVINLLDRVKKLEQVAGTR